jgi:hypothetical protein
MMIRILILVLLASVTVQAQTGNDVYLFSYFKGNGEDGLHLAYSEDGFRWQALQHDSSFLKPTAGKDKLMRDPCIVQSADGIFHMGKESGMHNQKILCIGRSNNIYR